MVGISPAGDGGGSQELIYAQGYPPAMTDYRNSL